MGQLKLVGSLREGVVERAFEVGHLREATDGDLMLFDIIPDGFDARLRGAVPRQVDQLHVGRRQVGLGGEDALAGVG